jgi:uncharacterized lipoprotein YmbA
MRALTVILIVCGVAACGSSPPTHSFTLTAVAPAGHVNPAPPFPVQVNAVHIPALLDRTEMVRETGSNGLSISEQDRWGAPLGEMARNVLARDLAKRMPPGTVIFPQAPAPQSAAHLVATIEKFGADPDGRVRLVGSWALIKGQPGKTIVQRDIDLEGKAAGTGAAGQAAGMSELLARLPDQIAAELNQPSLAHK